MVSHFTHITHTQYHDWIWSDDFIFIMSMYVPDVLPSALHPASVLLISL